MRGHGVWLPPGLVSINYDAGVFRYEEDGSSRDENDTAHFTVYGDGSIDIQATEMVGVSIEALEWIVDLAKQKRKAAFNETA